MQRYQFENINCNFTYKNLSPYLDSFWSDIVVNSGESEIWLSLMIRTRHESFRIIDIDIFNTKDYTYVNNLLRKDIYYSSIHPEYIIKELVIYFQFDSDVL